MNLLSSPWIRVCGLNEPTKIKVSELGEVAGVRLAFGRPDLNSSAILLLIGLIQVAAAPKSESDWKRWWFTPPTVEELWARLQRLTYAFDLTSQGPAFLQDFDSKLPKATRVPISALLMDSPGEQTLKQNKDLFNKRGTIEGLCDGCAAISLYALQTNAPSGGAGHRVGIRGGGPMSTLVIPRQNGTPISLWHTVWANVLPLSGLERREKTTVADEKLTFPWLAPTKTSEEGEEAHPEDLGFLHCYFGMPRRIRLSNDNRPPGKCDLCGDKSEALFVEYLTRPYGINYSEYWMHPATPYRQGPNTAPFSQKGESNGVGYANWLGWALGSLADSKQKLMPAMVVDYARSERSELLYDQSSNRDAAIWAFGYATDNMKVELWNDAILPFHPEIKDREFVEQEVYRLVSLARKSAQLVRHAVKDAWFRVDESRKRDLGFIETRFWQLTESEFYRSLDKIVLLSTENASDADLILKEWMDVLEKAALKLFDKVVLSSPLNQRQMERVIKSRNKLEAFLGSIKKKL